MEGSAQGLEPLWELRQEVQSTGLGSCHEGACWVRHEALSVRKHPWQLLAFVLAWRLAVLLSDMANMSSCKSEELCADGKTYSAIKKDEICRELDGAGK